MARRHREDNNDAMLWKNTTLLRQDILAMSLYAPPEFCRNISYKAAVERIAPLVRNPVIRHCYDYANESRDAASEQGELNPWP